MSVPYDPCGDPFDQDAWEVQEAAYLRLTDDLLRLVPPPWTCAGQGGATVGFRPNPYVLEGKISGRDAV